MEQFWIITAACAGIWALISGLIVWKGLIDKEYREDILRMSVGKILLIGVFWPIVGVGLIIYTAYLYALHRRV